MKNQTGFLVALAAILLHSCTPAKTLRYSGAFHPGDQLRYRMTENTETHVEAAQFGGHTIPPSVSTEQKTTTYTYTVKSVAPDHRAEFEMMVLDLKRVENGQEGVKAYDSADPNLDTTDITNRMLSTIIRKPLHFTISPTGQVTDFHGMNTVWENMAREASKASPLAGTMLENMKTQFGDETIGSQQQEFWGHVPAKGVARLGQHWKRKASVPAFGIAGIIRYTLEAYDERSARITFVSRYRVDERQPRILDMGMIKIRYNLVGSGAGTVLTDSATGLTRRIEQRVTMGGPMEVKTSFTDWTKVPMTITVNSVLERLD